LSNQALLQNALQNAADTRQVLIGAGALARQIRSRYTIFDLTAEAALFADCVEELFAPGGFWFAA
jgi:hypothetical protein